ncbi:hypothetical protein A0J61_09805 [Choanephora cucurbitarum]|uniref:Uncharacterized protein n=1 Tax=Choanephora cucurbitarum TaxID=101091 RepID=A0A1C7MZ98_9FUNG|nr:hypothetical protein A0J61_09805 [Choanephora cucurbitarum]
MSICLLLMKTLFGCTQITLCTTQHSYSVCTTVTRLAKSVLGCSHKLTKLRGSCFIRVWIQ